MSALVLLRVVLAVGAAAAPASRQDLPVPTEAVVMIFTPDETGSGFIVGQQGRRVWIVTARHVIDPKGPATDETGWTDCTAGVQIAFHPDAKARHDPVRASCNRDPFLDLAVIEAQLPERMSSLEPYAAGTPAATSPNFSLTVVGHPDGAPWAVSSGNRVTRYDPAVDPRNFTFTRQDVRPGFSGGPVIADGLVGMAVSTDHGGIGLQWGRIAFELSSLSAPTNLVKGEVTGVVTFDPPLAATLPDDAARNALRQYAHALNGLRRGDILSVYPSLNEVDLDALIGDTARLELKLFKCTRTDARAADPRATTASYSCGYSLDLRRRTGPPPAKPAASSRMVFDLRRGETEWFIEKIK